MKGLVKQGGKVILITSEGGSIGLRTEKEGGANYGHHMSKCAANMMGRLLAWDLKPKGIAVLPQFPSFPSRPFDFVFSPPMEFLRAWSGACGLE